MLSKVKSMALNGLEGYLVEIETFISSGMPEFEIVGLGDTTVKEAKKRKFDKIYLKTELINYYEKFGAKFIQNLKNGEKLYYFDLKQI